MTSKMSEHKAKLIVFKLLDDSILLFGAERLNLIQPRGKYQNEFLASFWKK
jgi:hypothetical protein